MSSPLMLLGAAAAALGGRYAYIRLAARKVGAETWVKGGFQQKMDSKEAKLILGIRSVLSPLFPFLFLFLLDEGRGLGGDLEFGLGEGHA